MTDNLKPIKNKRIFECPHTQKVWTIFINSFKSKEELSGYFSFDKRTTQKDIERILIWEEGNYAEYLESKFKLLLSEASQMAREDFKNADLKSISSYILDLLKK